MYWSPPLDHAWRTPLQQTPISFICICSFMVLFLNCYYCYLTKYLRATMLSFQHLSKFHCPWKYLVITQLLSDYLNWLYISKSSLCHLVLHCLKSTSSKYFQGFVVIWSNLSEVTATIHKVDYVIIQCKPRYSSSLIYSCLLLLFSDHIQNPINFIL